MLILCLHIFFVQAFSDPYPLSVRMFVSLLFSSDSFLYILNTDLLPDICFANISSQFVACLLVSEQGLSQSRSSNFRKFMLSVFFSFVDWRLVLC